MVRSSHIYLLRPPTNYTLLRLLVQRPALLKAVVEELDKAAEPLNGVIPIYTALAELKLLNAALSETIRLYPPEISGSPRRIPQEGLMIGQMYIPSVSLSAEESPTYVNRLPTGHGGASSSIFATARRAILGS